MFFCSYVLKTPFLLKLRRDKFFIYLDLFTKIFWRICLPFLDKPTLSPQKSVILQAKLPSNRQNDHLALDKRQKSDKNFFNYFRRMSIKFTTFALEF